MIIALYAQKNQWLEPVVTRLQLGGFRTMDLDEVVGGPDSLLDQAFQRWGADFRVKQVQNDIDPLQNWLISGVRSVEELKAFTRIRAAGVLSDGTPLTPEDIQFLETHKIPVVPLAMEATNDPEQIVAHVLKIAERLPRISWDDYFMGIAHIVASRGDCLKRRVAAIIVKDRRIVATGYNGAPRGTTNCGNGGCSRCAKLGPSGTDLGECLCSHGEENSITQAAYHGISVKDATIYSTTSPCLLCTKMIINSGIGEVVYNASYPLGERSLDLLREAGVKLRRHGEEEN